MSKLPFATENGFWNGDMFDDWLSGKPPVDLEYRRLWRIIWQYRKQEFEAGVKEGIRRATIKKAIR